ncbi:pyridoxal 5'-phosphate synthase [Leifsonia sp. A12D58]|uniref:pyridoxine/pyridoxamine 5'-phosphate oxidase n=1 Tax=Leifsonia sp. A12D58 TaxID=3397674 RepID=UPI0039E0C813
MTTDADPLTLFDSWLQQLGSHRPPPMTLGTIDADGHPDARTVLLSGHDSDAVYFNTDIRTRKAGELAADPRVSLVLLWPQADRQVAIQGDAEVTTDEQQAAAYAAQSRYLQLLAWQNDADTAALPAAERHARWAAFDRAHPEGSLTAPPTWIGYRISMRRITFWQSDANGPSTRVEYRRAGQDWIATVLPG